MLISISMETILSIVSEGEDDPDLRDREDLDHPVREDHEVNRGEDPHREGDKYDV